jgi:hypothetical protein
MKSITHSSQHHTYQKKEKHFCELCDRNYLHIKKPPLGFTSSSQGMGSGSKKNTRDYPVDSGTSLIGVVVDILDE